MKSPTSLHSKKVEALYRAFSGALEDAGFKRESGDLRGGGRCIWYDFYRFRKYRMVWEPPVTYPLRSGPSAHDTTTTRNKYHMKTTG